MSSTKKEVIRVPLTQLRCDVCVGGLTGRSL